MNKVLLRSHHYRIPLDKVQSRYGSGCAKCADSNNPSDASGYNTHNSASLECPMYLRECKRLSSMTDLTSKNVM